MRLSPENLSHDGELSLTETNRKVERLRKAWKRLEKKVGRSVSEQEIWELVYPYYIVDIIHQNREMRITALLAEQVMRGE